MDEDNKTMSKYHSQVSEFFLFQMSMQSCYEATPEYEWIVVSDWKLLNAINKYKLDFSNNGWSIRLFLRVVSVPSLNDIDSGEAAGSERWKFL